MIIIISIIIVITIIILIIIIINNTNYDIVMISYDVITIINKLASSRLRSGDGFSVVSLYDNICILLIL